MADEPDELEELAARCTNLVTEIRQLLGSRDDQDRRRRVCLRRQYRRAKFEFKDVCNDLIIGLEAGFPWESDEKNQDS